MRAIYDLMKLGPTSANCSPARIVFLCAAPRAKAKLRPTLSSGNVEKPCRRRSPPSWPGITRFYERLPALFPHGDARSWFTSSPQLAEETAFRNSSLQAAYLIFRLPLAGSRHRPDVGIRPRESRCGVFFANSGWKKQSTGEYRLWRPRQIVRPAAAPEFLIKACLLA